MPWARASSLHRFLACPAASWLPRWDESRETTLKPYLRVDTPHQPYIPPRILNPALLVPRDMRAATLGRERHAEKERGEFFPEGYAGMATGWHEVALSYCCKTGRVRWLADVDERRKNLWKALQCEHSVVGTADWLGILASGVPWVDDLKTGWRTPEVLTPQTLFYSMCLHDMVEAGVSRWAGATAGPVAVSITHQPRGKGTPTRGGLWRRVTPLVVEQFRADLTEAWMRTTLDRSERPGEHCQWCPSAAWCSAQTADGF